MRQAGEGTWGTFHCVYVVTFHCVYVVTFHCVYV